MNFWSGFGALLESARGELWDFDFTSRNDHLGTFHLELNQTPGHYGTILSNNMDVSEEADYMLNWEILEG